MRKRFKTIKYAAIPFLVGALIFNGPTNKENFGKVLDDKIIEPLSLTAVDVKDALEYKLDLNNPPERISETLRDVYESISIPKPDYFNKEFIKEIIRVESGFDSNAVSNRGARGLMQLMEGTFKERSREIYDKSLSFDKAFDPEVNIRVGIHHLLWINQYAERRHPQWNELDNYEKMRAVKSAYNAGAFRMASRDWDIKRAPLETRRYIDRIERGLKGQFDL
ncbi:MAG: transglycosylase SLT domain-containing protein [Candidatus Pacearchaeota archaeon]